MKKLYIIALGAVAMTATAAQPVQKRLAGRTDSKTDVRAEYAALHQAPAKKLLGKAQPTAAAMHAPAADAVQHDWVDAGTGYMTDDITTSFWTDEAVTIEVTFQKDQANEGWWRVLNPWKNHPEADEINAGDDTSLDQTDATYILINASDPDYVRIPASPIGMADADGDAILMSLTELVGVELSEGVTLSQEEADLSAGTLVDGAISFPIANGIALFQDPYYYAANGDGLVAFYLPGTELPVDYGFDLEYGPRFCPDSDNNYTISVSGDDRIEKIVWLASPEFPNLETEDDLDAFLLKMLREGTAASINGSFKVNVSNIDASEIYVFVASVDGDGNAQDAYYLPLAVPQDNSPLWAPYGKADMTEGFLSCSFPTTFTSETFEVDVERNTQNPGLLRIVNPYKAWPQTQDFQTDHSHSHYIMINAEDPANVYITQSGLGLSLGTLGEVGIDSDYNLIIQQFGKLLCDMFGITSGGYLDKNVITFDGSAYIKLYIEGVGKWIYTNMEDNPEYDADAAQEAYENGEDYDIEPYLPGKFKLDLTKAAGIHDLESAVATDAEAVYYNLQGQRIAAPARGTVCIRQRAGKSDKVVIL